MEQTAPAPLVVPKWQRHLLPGNAVDARGGKRSVRDWIVDLHVLSFAVAGGAGALSETWDDASRPFLWTQIAIGLVACVALWWRRQRPVAVAVVVLALAVVSLCAAGAAFVVVFNAAIRTSTRTLIVIAVLATLVTSFAPALYTDNTITDVLASLVAMLIFVGWGLFVRVQRDLVAALHHQAEQADAERAAEAERARDAERRRIAREMHDVLAHRISMVSLHAGALEHRGASASSEEVTQVAGVIRDSAVAAMEELRGVIGVLRQEDREGAAMAPPQPTLASIPALIEENRAAGMVVTADLDQLPPSDDAQRATELAAYRIVQEGLTNARKHAAGAAVHVRGLARDGELVLTVRSDPRVGAPQPEGSSAHAGLIGLRERAALLGGTITTTTDDAGRFVLVATLPWSER